MRNGVRPFSLGGEKVYRFWPPISLFLSLCREPDRVVGRVKDPTDADILATAPSYNKLEQDA